MGKDDFLLCTKCGASIRRGQRNCLKCGQLNFENPDNEYMKKYVPKKNKKNGKPNNGLVDRLSIYNNKRPNEMTATHAGNLSIFMLANLLIFIFVFFVIIFSEYNAKGFLHNDFIFTLLKTSIVFLEFYSIQLLLMKANRPWWYIFIIFVICLFLSFIIGYFDLKFLVYILVIGAFIIFYNIGRVFGINPWLMAFFMPIMLPIIAFSNTVSYKEIIYVVENRKRNGFEVLNKFNKFIFSLSVSGIIISLVLLLFSYKDVIIYKINKPRYDKFINDIIIITVAAEKSIQEDEYTCSNGLTLSEQSSYYISFDNAASYFNLSDVDVSPFSGANYQGYISVINPNERQDYTSYYISVDDTVYGIYEENFENIDEIVIKKNKFTVLPDNVVVCRKNNT